MPVEFKMYLELPGIPFIVVAIAEVLGIYEILMLYPRRFSAPVPVLLFPLILAGQVFLRCYGIPINGMPGFYRAMAVNVAYMMLCSALLCRGNIWSLLSAGMLAFIFAETMAAITWPLFKWLTQDCGFSEWSQLVMVTGSMILIQLLIAFSFRKVRFSAHSSPFMMLRITVLALMGFLLSNSLFITGSSSYLGIAASYCITRAAVDLCVLALVYSMKLYEKRVLLEKESAAINSVVEMQYKQYQEYKESVEYIARQCHDLKHQLAVLRDARHRDVLDREMDRMQTMIERYESATNTGNAVLDILLTQKLIYCREHDIQMSYTADGRLLGELPATDICALFGNLLENAIEHVQTLELLEDRQIILSVQSKGSLLAVKVENRCDRITQDPGQLPATTKKDRSRHGFGCRSVLQIAQSCGGTAEFRSEDGWFTASVLLPITKSFSNKSAEQTMQ